MPTNRRWEVRTLSTDFRAAAQLVRDKFTPLPGPGHVVVRNEFVGINATDINVTNGSYLGVVEDIGSGVSGVNIGDAVAYRALGAFADYTEVPVGSLIHCEKPDPEWLSLMVSGASAWTALAEVGRMRSNETVLVTAAAGGSGQFAVQLAKLAGNHVIGTCSSDSKVAYLKHLGCDRVINCDKEQVADVLRDEYPNGVDLVFECVGGEMFKVALEHLAVRGRLIIFGYVSGYQQGGGLGAGHYPLGVSEVAPLLLSKSASICGFHSVNHTEAYATYLRDLVQLVRDKKVVAGVDPHVFLGLERVPEAIDSLFARKNSGKIVVRVSPEGSARATP
ncbi:hypothetical protein ATCC90586_001740 [Pythium insidiosum]|nr:hypothetical protein ATCC90586_001740 [Pythium insidiosum]